MIEKSPDTSKSYVGGRKEKWSDTELSMSGSELDRSSDSKMSINTNKTVYTATEVACGWAGPQGQ